ncbi:MAG: 3-deoxy-D-manno-octulosonic acid transferase [Isosphaeraceae bacterium]|jgi:3-deoxy-D-manno-octulosonic-acid transferase|nr:MAG: 3-deoxy-D-manno-octulosonic acid transferase [Isosphaeraceae bacterium]
MRYVRDVAYLVLLLLAAPVLLFKAWKQGKYREGWSAKLWGKAPRRLGQRPCLWFHAVSVGEVKLLGPLIEQWQRRHPDWDVVVSTTTATGLELARRAYPDLITFYAPLDFSWAVRRAVERIRPSILALVELELWPNLIEAAARAQARVAIVNARLSAASFRGYRRLGPLLRSTLRRLDLVAAQSQDYADRFLALGVERNRVLTTGSIKYDGLESDRGNPQTIALRQALGLKTSEIVFVAGSTMEGEEAAALDAYQALRRQHPGLRLVLVPRHPDRFDAVAALIDAKGEPGWRRSHGVPAPRGAEPPPVLLVDTLGELSAVWGLADIAYVGGSLRPGRGGQNVMEPAAYAASVIFGPYTENFREATDRLLASHAARRVSSADQLREALRADLEDPEAAHERGQAARRIVLAQQGAAARTAAALDELIAPPRSTPIPIPGRPLTVAV